MVKRSGLSVWKDQKKAADCQSVDCPPYDPYGDFVLDPTGYYVLIRVSFEYLRIEAAVCDKDHRIVAIFKGRSGQDIYHAIFDQEKKLKADWFREKSHVAYLGKELKKAELALVTGNAAYFQE